MVVSEVFDLISKMKFPIVCALFATAVWIAWGQYQRGNEWKENAEKSATAYNALVEHGQKIQQELADREKTRIAREEENGKRLDRIRKALEDAKAREWAATPIPQSIIDELRVVLPEVSGGSGHPSVAAGGSR